MAIVAKDASKNILLQIVTSQIGVERNTMPVRVEPHAHLFYEVVFLVKGVLRHHIQIQGELYEREQIVGDIFAIAPNEEHWYDDSADVAFYNLYISPGVFAEMQQRLHSDGGFNSLAMLPARAWVPNAACGRAGIQTDRGALPGSGAGI